MKPPTTRIVAVVAVVVGIPVLVGAGYLMLTRGEKIHLQTERFATPLLLSRDPERVFTSVEIRGRLRRDGESGSATVVFAEEPCEFNEFGDCLRMDARGSTTLLAALRLVKRDGSPEKPRRLYEVTLIDEIPDIRLYLTLAPESSGDHRLVLWMGESRDDTQDCQVLTLHDRRSPQRPQSGAPLAAPFRLTTRDRFPRPSASQYHEQFGTIETRMSPDLSGSVHHGGNIVSSTAFGDPRFVTAVFYPSIAGVFRETAATDPTGADRKVYDFVPSDPGWFRRVGISYALVLGRTKEGPHRVIVRERQKIQHVLTLLVEETP